MRRSTLINAFAAILPEIVSQGFSHSFLRAQATEVKIFAPEGKERPVVRVHPKLRKLIVAMVQGSLDEPQIADLVNIEEWCLGTDSNREPID